LSSFSASFQDLSRNHNFFELYCSNLAHLCNQHFDLQKVYNMLYHCEGIRKVKSISSYLLIPSPTGPTGVLLSPTGRLSADLSVSSINCRNIIPSLILHRRRLSHANNFCFSTTSTFRFLYSTMDERPNKPSKRKPAKTSHPSLEEKEAMTAELEKVCPKSVQPAPLEPPQVFMPPVGDSGTAAPPYKDAPSNVAAASNVCPEGYDYGNRYGATRPPASIAHRWTSVSATRGLSTVTTRLRRCPTSAPGYVDAYSAPFNDPNAYGQGHCASNAATQRESQAPPALNRMERILESIEHATSASSLQLQLFFCQGDLIFYFVEIFRNY
jgi:hypothetical protein